MHKLQDDPQATFPSEADAAADPAGACERRIDDYLEASLKKGDAFEANLGAINAGLMRIAHRFQYVLDDVLRQPPQTLAGMSEFMPGVDGYLRVVKQVDRMSQLALKLQGMNGEA